MRVDFRIRWPALLKDLPSGWLLAFSEHLDGSVAPGAEDKCKSLKGEQEQPGEAAMACREEFRGLIERKRSV